MPIMTPENVAEIAAGAGALPAATPDGAAPAVDANPGYREAMIAALSSYPAAEHAERLAKINADAGWKEPDPLIAAEHAHAEAHAIAIDAKPENYQFEFPASFIEGAKDLAGTTAEMRQMAADLKLPASMGKTLLEHLASRAGYFKGLNDAQAVAHRVQAEAALVSTFGSQERADEMLAQARAALGIAPSNKLAAALGQSLALLDPLILAVLVGHGQRHALFQKGGKK